MVTEFLPEKFLRNRLGTASVIPRKKVLIPRHSEVYGRVYSEARNGRKWHEKNLFKKILLQQTELTACFRLRHASEHNSLSCCLFRGMLQSRIPSVCLHFVPRNGIPSCFIFCGMVQNRIPSVCFEFCSMVYSVFRGIIFLSEIANPTSATSAAVRQPKLINQHLLHKVPGMAAWS